MVGRSFTVSLSLSLSGRDTRLVDDRLRLVIMHQAFTQASRASRHGTNIKFRMFYQLTHAIAIYMEK